MKKSVGQFFSIKGNFYSNTGKQRKYDNFTNYLFLKLYNRKCDIRKGQKIKKGVRQIRNDTKITNYLTFDILNLSAIHLEFPYFKWSFLYC